MTENWKDEIFYKVIKHDKPCSYEMIYEAINLTERHFTKRLKTSAKGLIQLHNIFKKQKEEEIELLKFNLEKRQEVIAQLKAWIKSLKKQLRDFKLIVQIEERTRIRKKLEEVHDVLDNLNSEKGNYCLFCDGDSYNGKEGIIHNDNCIILRLRKWLKEGD